MARRIVAGGGVLGLACAWALIRRGAEVQVVERDRIGAGSSGGHVGALAPHAPDTWNIKKALQLDSLLAAPDFWAGVEQAGGVASGYGRTGRLQPVPDRATADRLADRIAGAARHWPEGLGMALIRDPDTPLAPDSPTGLWLHDDLTARLNPRAALRALTAAIRAEGGTITEQHIPDTATLWATGTDGLHDLTRDLGRKIGQGVKGQSLLLDYAAPHSPQIFADGIHIVPHADGTTAVGSTSENSYAHTDPDDQLDDLLTRARAICPALNNAPVIDRWAGIRPRAQSRAPLIGAWPGRPGQFVANGGFKIGFGMAPIIADMMADLILTGTDRIPDMFRLT
ncbi:FAD-binding oxidoreductase [Paracoccus sp. (in: a-proteobacteria)]|uniref:NAD(P)/FAD-dependent oxidoreductase n=1 Tax=Paracoccus sp. TaxID=267 RepID=UPI0026E10749|nr:FAD-dependent oxidoreductase [Paracoccus sp. (in: a-proteobacteria)]MDO5647715.1 FAD-dependent oxidoreductase [Paracoccus sp. (in: a-proteobacteria)]